MTPQVFIYVILLALFAWALWQIVSAIEDSVQWFKSRNLPTPKIEDRIE